MRHIYNLKTGNKKLLRSKFFLIPILIIIFIISFGFNAKSQTSTVVGSNLCYQSSGSTVIGVNKQTAKTTYALYFVDPTSVGTFTLKDNFYYPSTSNGTGTLNFSHSLPATGIGEYVVFSIPGNPSSITSSFTTSTKPSTYNQITGAVWIYDTPSNETLSYGGILNTDYTINGSSAAVYCSSGSGSVKLNKESNPFGDPAWDVTYNLYSNGVLQSVTPTLSGNTLTWSGLADNNYYIKAHRDGCLDITMGNNSIVTGSITNHTRHLCFNSIQEAINSSQTQPNDTIDIADGTYTENITINKPLRLRFGSINGAELEGTIDITADNVIVDFQNLGSGIFAIGYSYAIDIDPGVHNYLIENIPTILSDQDGIYIDGAYSGTITNNVIGTNFNNGININSLNIGSILTISNNSFSSNGYLGGSDILNNANGTVINNNTFDGTSTAIYNTGSGVTITYNNFDNVPSSGIGIQNVGGTITTINHNSFGGSDMSKTAISTDGAIDAHNNFFGSVKGPTEINNTCGDGWIVTDNLVTYEPWYDDAIGTHQVYKVIAYNVTSSTSTTCPSTNITVSLDNSQTGVDYTLYQYDNNTGDPATAISSVKHGNSGSALNWTDVTSAECNGWFTYTVQATNTISNCTLNMNGSPEVTYEDHTPPTITSGGDVSVNNHHGDCSASVTVPDPTANDNCSVASVINDYNNTAHANDVYPVGTTTVTWTVTDGCGHTATCTQLVTVTDNENPTIVSLPTSITKNNDPTVCGAVATWVAPTPHDNCPGSSIAQTAGPVSGSTFPIGTTTITYTATDAYLNTHSESFTVTVTDNENPTITSIGDQHVCAQDTANPTQYTVTGLEFNPNPLLITDNCGVASVSNNYTGTSPLAGIIFTGLTNSLTWTVTDIHGNTNHFTVNIAVNTKPIPQITGSTVACSGDSKVYYDKENVAGTFTYQWSVYNGVITQNANTSSITVKWNSNCVTGWLQLTKTNTSTGCVTTTTKYNVTINPLPTPVVMGSTSVVSGTTTTYYTVGTSNLYSWSVSGGTIQTGQGTHQITVLWGNCSTCSGTVSVTETTQPSGCSATSSINVTITGTSKSLFGQISYDNASGTSLNGLTVQLVDNSNAIAATTTSYSLADTNGVKNGYYEFTNIAAGTYTINVTTTKPWGGVNATDALLVKLHTIAQTGFVLTDLPLKAGDVNLSSSVNSTDALLLQLRSVGLINTFDAGNWVYANTSSISVPALGEVSNDIQALCTGDVNASYPILTSSKSESFTNLQKEEVVQVNNSQEIEIPIRVNDMLSLGAVSLNLSYNQSLVEVTEVTSKLEGINYNIVNGKVMVAWSNVSPVTLQNNDILLTLKVKAKDAISSSDNIFSYGDNTEFADGNGRIVHFSALKVNALETNTNNNGISVYPNPYRDNAVVDYTLVESGSVKLSIYNSVGQRLNVLVDEYKSAGNYKLNLNTLDLPNGIYSCEIIINGETSKYKKVIKLVKTH